MEFTINGKNEVPPDWLARLNGQVKGAIRRVNVGSHCRDGRGPVHAHRDPAAANFGLLCIDQSAWNENGPTATMLHEAAHLATEQTAYENRRDRNSQRYFKAGHDRRWRRRERGLLALWRLEPAEADTPPPRYDRQRAVRLTREAGQALDKAEAALAASPQAEEPGLLIMLAEAKLKLAELYVRFNALESRNNTTKPTE